MISQHLFSGAIVQANSNWSHGLKLFSPRPRKAVEEMFNSHELKVRPVATLAGSYNMWLKQCHKPLMTGNGVIYMYTT